MANLHFFNTRTVEQLKAEEHISRIDVKNNLNTNKLFFTYGAKTGAVAVKGIPQHPMFSIVHPDLDREPTPEEAHYIGRSVELDGKRVADPRANGYFMLLHEEGQGGAPVLASF